MPGLAFALLTLYGALALGLRAILQRQRTGSTGIVGLVGSAGSIEWLAGVLFWVAIAVSVAAPFIDLSDSVNPIPALDKGFVQVAGVVLAVGGIVATVLAQLAMGDAWRVGVDHGQRTELVTSGPFSAVRNPIFAATIPAFAGITLLNPSVVAFVGFALLVIALELQTRVVEEPYLRQTHGSAYLDYASRVGRFIPGVGRLKR